MLGSLPSLLKLLLGLLKLGQGEGSILEVLDLTLQIGGELTHPLWEN